MFHLIRLVRLLCLLPIGRVLRCFRLELAQELVEILARLLLGVIFGVLFSLCVLAGTSIVDLGHLLLHFALFGGYLDGFLKVCNILGFHGLVMLVFAAITVLARVAEEVLADRWINLG